MRTALEGVKKRQIAHRADLIWASVATRCRGIFAFDIR